MNEMTAVGYRVFIGFLSVWPAIDGTFQAADFESIANENGPFFFSTWSLMWHSILFPIRAPDVPGRRLCKVDGISASLSFQQLLLLLLRQMFRSTPIFHGDVASLIVWFVFLFERKWPQFDFGPQSFFLLLFPYFVPLFFCLFKRTGTSGGSGGAACFDLCFVGVCLLSRRRRTGDVDVFFYCLRVGHWSTPRYEAVAFVCSGFVGACCVDFFPLFFPFFF